jgi:hypothetical protein
VAEVGDELRKEPNEITDMGRGEYRCEGADDANLAPFDVVDETILNPPYAAMS